MDISDALSARASRNFIRIGAVAGMFVFILGVGLNALLEPPEGPGYDATVANGALTIGLWRMPSLADQPQAFTVIWSLSSVLFNTVMWAWALMLIGFSLAGWYSAVMGRWLSALGLVGGGAALLTAAGVGSVLSGGWMTGPWAVSLAVFPVWVLATSALMFRQSRGTPQHARQRPEHRKAW